MSDFLKKQLRSYYESMGYKVGEIEIKGDTVNMTVQPPQAIEFVIVNVSVDTGEVLDSKPVRNIQ